MAYPYVRRLTFALMSVLNLFFTAAAWAGGGIGTVPIVLNVSASNNCSMSTGGLTYRFTGLKIGIGMAQTSRFAVKCSGSVSVKMNTLWEGNLLSGRTYTFPDNKDTVDVEFCYAGTSQCWDETDSTFVITQRDMDLRLTYTANVIELDKTRNGTLQLSYE